MAAAGLKVSVERTDVGDYVLGATIDKVFVPFVSVSGAHAEAIIAKARSSSSSSDDDEGGDE